MYYKKSYKDNKGYGFGGGTLFGLCRFSRFGGFLALFLGRDGLGGRLAWR